MANTSQSEIDHIVFLLHGIRDLGGWQADAKDRLERAIPGVRCEVVKYGWFDPLSFLSPFDLGGAAYKKVHRRYQDIRGVYPDCKFSIIAHSFGTHLAGRLIKNNPEAQFHRVIFCGAVLKEDFPWIDYRDAYGVGVEADADAVLNECGTSDPWPIIASAMNGRYGATGAYGFEAPYRVQNRTVEGNHSEFFRRAHIESSWIPFVKGERLGPGNALTRSPGFIERIIRSGPGIRFIVRGLTAILWFALTFWWLWILVALLWYFCFVQLPFCTRTADQFSEGLNQSGVAIVRSGTDSIFS